MRAVLIIIKKMSPAFAGLLAVMIMASQISMVHAMAGQHHTGEGAAVSVPAKTSSHAGRMQNAAMAAHTGLHDDKASLNDHQSGHCATMCMSALVPLATPATMLSFEGIRYSGISSTGFGKKLAGLKRPPRT